MNRIVRAWIITSIKSRYLPGFLKLGMTKNHKRQNGSINIVLVSQNFHQSPKDITIWTILSFQAFFINFHQKLVFYFCFKHLLKNLSQGYYGLSHTVLLEKFDKFYKKHVWLVAVFFQYFRQILTKRQYILTHIVLS